MCMHANTHIQIRVHSQVVMHMIFRVCRCILETLLGTAYAHATHVHIHGMCGSMQL